jgi:hypothetical protein
MMSSASIGEEGRTVRCAKCMHEWFQEPEEGVLDDSFNEADEVLEESSLEEDMEEIDVEDRLKDIASQLMDEDDDQDQPNDAEEEIIEAGDDLEENSEEEIPESVKPVVDQDEDFSDFVPPKPEVIAEVQKTVPLQAKLMGYAASIALFALVFGSALIFKNTIVKAWPPSMAIYELAGFETRFKGQELIMETLRAEAIPQEDGTETLIMKGRVVNLTDQTMDVPSMIAVLRDTDGKAGASWLIDSPVDQVEAGASFVFKSEYAGLPSGTGAVNLTFAPEIVN